MQKPLLGLLIACIMFLTAACMGGSEEPTPTPTVPPATVAPTAVVQAQQAVQDTPAPTATPPDAAPTAAPTPAAPPNLIALEALNIRGGPGIEYPLIGNLGKDGDAPVLGRSDSGSWYRIECPDGLDAPECWVIGDEAFVRIEGAQGDAGAPADAAVAVVPTPLAPPTPTATPVPTAPPCAVEPPSGWVRYTIASGDTVYSIAARHGVTMAQLRDVNCVGDVLYAGDTLYVPARAGTQAGSGTGAQASADDRAGGNEVNGSNGSNGSNGGTDGNGGDGVNPTPKQPQDAPRVGSAVVITSVPSAGAVLDFAFMPPFVFSCPSAVGAPTVVRLVKGISSRSYLQENTFATGDGVIISKANALTIHVCNVDPANPLTGITVKRQGGADATPLFFSLTANNNYRARWVPRKGDLAGTYVVTATFDGADDITETFNVSDTELPMIAVDPESARIGQSIDVILAGFQPGNHVLHIYSMSGNVKYSGRIENIWVDDSGERIVPLDLTDQWLVGGYIIDLGDNPVAGNHGRRRMSLSENAFTVGAP